jgi:diguanylate cyclase (GGDEF)-like protein/PAS domain S-box-containing protein
MELELIKGVALLLALCLLHGFNIRALRARPTLSNAAAGVLFGVVAVASVFIPLMLNPLLVLDARSLILSLAGLFGGVVAAALALVIAVLHRLYVGGSGIGLDVLLWGLSAALGVLYRCAVAREKLRIHVLGLLALGVALVVLQVLLGTSHDVQLPIACLQMLVVVCLGLMLKDVHTRMETVLSLAAKEARLRATIHAIPGWLCVLDEEGVYVEVLSRNTDAPGSSAGLVGKRMHDVLPAQEADLILSMVQRTLALSETQTFEYCVTTHEGLRRFEGRTHPLGESSSHRPAVVMLARDVTERSAAQEELKASEARFRNLLQDIPSVAVQGYDAHGVITYWNSASERLYGFRAEEVVGRNALEGIVPHPVRSTVQAALQRMQATGVAVEPAELILLHQSGREVPVMSSYSVVTHGDQPMEFFRFDIDLSERQRTEAELRVAATAFEAQEGMMVTNARREILRVNHAFTRISGYSPEEVIGKKPSMFSSGWHDAAFYRQLNQVLDTAGTWEGEIWNRRKNGEVFPQWLHITAVSDEDGRLTHYVATITDITQRKAAEDQIRQLAFYDPLTGLPNRRMLMDRLQHALASSARNGSCGALLFIDLDHFKNLNDTLGHDKGDLLLQQVAQRLINTVRQEDTVARLGGDEYVVMLEGLDTVREAAALQATTVGSKIVETLNAPYRLAGHEYHSTPSMGLALFSGNEATIDELLKHADLAMYQAKSAGRNGLRFFDPQMQASVTQRAELEADIRQGILVGQFSLHYQPQVDAQGCTIGAEALLRWKHPTRGMVSPAQFIPVAEESGQILSLGSWVLEAACAQLVEWAKTPAMADLTLAVNVSSRQFRQQDFADYVLGLLDYTGANPTRLKLELTESLLAENLDDVITKMSALRARGVGFSLDDFGTGYSSLAYLKSLPLDQLKIDQSFVRDVLDDPNDAAIAKTIVALAHSLGLAVIAEGVETHAQRDFLLENGCSTYQGYLFSRPLPAEQFEAFVHTARQNTVSMA